MLAKAPDTLGAVGVGHEQACHLEGEHRQHTGHGVEQKACQDAEQKSLAKAVNLDACVRKDRLYLEVEACRGWQGCFPHFLGLSGKICCLRVRLGESGRINEGHATSGRHGSHGFHAPHVHGKLAHAGIGGHWGSLAGKLLPSGKPGLFAGRTGVFGNPALERQIQGCAAGGRTQKKAQGSGKALACAFFWQGDKEVDLALVDVDAGVLVEEVALYGTLGVVDRQGAIACARLVEDEGELCRASHISRIVGVGVGPLGDFHAKGSHNAVLVRSEGEAGMDVGLGRKGRAGGKKE